MNTAAAVETQQLKAQWIALARLSNAPLTTNYAEPDIARDAPGHVRRKFFKLLRSIRKLDSARNGKGKLARKLARRLGVSRKTLLNLRTQFHAHGPSVLVNRRDFQTWRINRDRTLPSEFARFVRSLGSEAGLSRPAALRHLAAQLTRWRNGDPLAAIPAYASPPIGNPPAGWSPRNLVRFLPARPCAAVVLRLSADGTTKIISGKFSAIPLHPLSSAIDAHILAKGK